jgi:flagellar motility protein MotE (MotC chaperone)
MNKLIQSPATVLLLGGVLFFGTMTGVLSSIHLGTVKPQDKDVISANDDPSWKFHNPEIQEWISQIKQERDSLAVREQQLKEWEAQLTAQSRELSMVTRAMSNIQREFDQRVVTFSAAEQDNAKKQVKIIAGMSSDGAASMLGEMSDTEATKLLYLMKNEVVSGILEAMGRQGPEQARRASTLGKKIKEVMNTPNANPNTAYASH